jgi:hypothetical protein
MKFFQARFENTFYQKKEKEFYNEYVYAYHLLESVCLLVLL